LLDELDGYSVVGVRAEYRLGRRASVFASIDNLLDEEYETFGLFGEADDVLGDEFDEPYFVGPGAPRAAWIGFRIEL
jgi:outer membrane receptor protein involved in Fe transport